MARASDYVEEIAADYVDGGDPIESAGLFEGDIDNVPIGDMNQIRSRVQRVSQGEGERDRQTDKQTHGKTQRDTDRETEKDK